MDKYDAIIVGTGPAGMGAAFSILEKRPKTVSLSAINTGISDDTRLKSMPTSTYAFGPQQS